ncbi:MULTISPECIES: TfoX/Sxy family DNA transformation protein [Pantoea]|uniref:TfoX/Sxy family DNA transformation protein n=1 Tax=Pantoea eucrina TaxID=472693 RepID=A0ABS1Z272_9GAMM|nr:MULTISPECIES: TfoX/Sxy family DNA transformation protein [Pantoea]AIX52162.1 competence protein TfoX [Pantoea sp. PSNIH1]MBM0746504.1 TfoX/Sxy family DNA transformation protein [Pantoea eucrina]MCL9646159.1 TfoX/Sxy family DNA transformation protein [Pantoea eucrina]MDJ0025108.1 TfoX/Sxy family DNA transformation protein [Pantoea eucrina]OIX94409.1 competence protein TfoX [Pantoea sp. Ae16]
MKRKNEVVEQSIDALSVLGDIESRTQFGGYALAIERVVFAYIDNDTLYLRASEALRLYAVQRPLEPLVYRKRGIPVTLSYFKVDQQLWQDRRQLIRLSASSLQAAQADAAVKNISLRLKDLPNLSLRMELMLHKAGISSVESLQEMGSRQSWLKLRSVNKHVGLKTLLALEGAISGHHQAALPADVKEALSSWYQERLRR